jgi:hypothetical protein
MLKGNLFDEAARILAMPIPRRKAFKYVGTGLASGLLSPLLLKRAAAGDIDSRCIPGCPGGHNTAPSCIGKRVDDRCTVGGKAGHCALSLICESQVICSCIPGPPPDAPAIATIPEVTITREASLAVGNCKEGTDLVFSWFPGTPAVSAREAAAEAIARGKPRLARYIARTAHLVHRNGGCPVRS